MAKSKQSYLGAFLLNLAVIEHVKSPVHIDHNQSHCPRHPTITRTGNRISIILFYSFFSTTQVSLQASQKQVSQHDHWSDHERTIL